MISVFNTFIHPAAHKTVREVLDTTFVSEGETVKAFESALCETFGFHRVSTVNSGTAALHLALDVLELQPGDEVIIPAQTFIATGLAVLYCKARPVFCDISFSDGNMDPQDIERRITSRTKAVICVHWGGKPCDLDAIGAICRKHGIALIEDAAHALGATYRGQPIGNIGDLTCFSFQAIKHLTTGDGGAIAARTEEYMAKILARRWFGIDREHAAAGELGERIYNLAHPGFKYHLNNYAAALGLANLVGIKERLHGRRKLAAYYTGALQGIQGLELFSQSAGSESAWWLFGMHVEKRLDFIRMMKSNGIVASVVHQRIDRNSVFGGPFDLPAQQRFDDTQVHIPIHDGISEADAAFIVETIRRGW